MVSGLQPTSIVLVEDDPDYADLVFEGLLAAWPGELEVERFARLAEARSRLDSRRADCVLLDLSLPDAHGLDALQDLLSSASHTPVVVLTGRGEEDGLGAEAVRLGAQDYLVKGRASDEMIGRAVRYAIERKRAEVERTDLEAEYEKIAGVAAELQRGLVPELPSIPGLVLGARYEPSAPAGRVGGDWFDVIALPGDRVGIAVGDVAGHGLHAASLMGQLSSALRAYALTDSSPGAVVSALNAMLCHYAPTEVATLVYGVLEADRRSVRLTSAGHMPALRIRAQGDVELLEGGRTTLLGCMPGDGPVPEEETELHPGDTLVLYTDGLVERRAEVIDAGLSRLVAAARAADGAAPDDLAGILVETLAPAGEREDDVAVLAVCLSR